MPQPVVAFESPRRLPASLAVLAAAMPDRPAAVCRELTKRFEEVAHGTVAELAERFAEPPRGEITARARAAGVERRARPGRPRRLEAVAELVAAGVPRRQAVDVVARLTGVARNALYRGLSVTTSSRSLTPRGRPR